LARKKQATQAGYKSKGYAIGEQLNKELIIRAGLTFKIVNKSLYRALFMVCSTLIFKPIYFFVEGDI